MFDSRLRHFFFLCCASLRHLEPRFDVLSFAASVAAIPKSGFCVLAAMVRDFNFDDSDYDSLTNEEKGNLFFLHSSLKT